MKLTDKIHLLRHDFEIMLEGGRRISRFVNSLAIFGEEITLVDAGVKGSFDGIIRYISQQGRDPAEISRLILSHSHPDHIGSAMKLKGRTDCEILAHQAEKDWMEDIELQQQQRPVPGFTWLADEPVKPDGFLNHEQELKAAGEVTLRVIHSPGHSRGSLNIQFLEDSMLFTADSIPVMNDIPNYEDYHDLVESLKAIRQNTGYTTLISSWASPVSSKDEINQLLSGAEAYLKRLDDSVQKHYNGQVKDTIECCAKVIRELSLPEFYIHPIVDKAFQTHLL
jgi:hydroxyacylglutathione hydrolase